MAKKSMRRATINVRIYKDTHDILKNHSNQYRQSISGIIHSLALGLLASKTSK